MIGVRPFRVCGRFHEVLAYREMRKPQTLSDYQRSSIIAACIASLIDGWIADAAVRQEVLLKNYRQPHDFKFIDRLMIMIGVIRKPLKKPSPHLR